MEKKNYTADDEIRLDLKDLLLHVFLHWRSLLIISLVGAILIGGGKYALDTVNYRRATAITEDNQSDEMNRALIDLTAYERQLDYNQHSLLMRIDSNAIPTQTLSYLITGNNCYASASLYKKFLTDTQLSQNVTEKLDLQETGFSIEDLVSSTIEYDTTVMLVDTSNSILLNVSIMATDKDQCQDIVSCLTDYMEQVKPLVTQAVAVHECRLVGSTYSLTKSATIKTVQQNNITGLDSLENQLNTSLADLNTAEKLYLEQVRYTLKGLEPVTKASFSKKLTVLGAVGIFVLLCAWWVLAYLFSRRLHLPEDLPDRFGLYLITTVTRLPVKKASALDRWLKRVLHSGSEPLDADAATRILTRQIALLAQAHDAKTVLAVGSERTTEEQALFAAVKTALVENAITLETGSYPASDPHTAELLESAEAVIITEKTDFSVMSDVERTVYLCRELQKPVLGAVVFR